MAPDEYDVDPPTVRLPRRDGDRSMDGRIIGKWKEGGVTVQGPDLAHVHLSSGKDVIVCRDGCPLNGSPIRSILGKKIIVVDVYNPDSSYAEPSNVGRPKVQSFQDDYHIRPKLVGQPY